MIWITPSALPSSAGININMEKETKRVCLSGRATLEPIENDFCAFCKEPMKEGDNLKKICGENIFAQGRIYQSVRNETDDITKKEENTDISVDPSLEEFLDRKCPDWAVIVK